MIKANILIVDDDVNLRSLLVYEIKKAGFNVAEAEDVKGALLILMQEEIHVVLTDVQLPDGNGIELTQMIKAAYPLIEIIVITAEGRISDGVNAIQKGAFDYLVKGEDNHRMTDLLTIAGEKALMQSRISMLENEVNNFESKKDIIAQNAEQIERAALIIKAIHSPLRKEIMQFIFARGKANVTEIYTVLNLEQAIASQHLLILKNAGLVISQREGKKVYYSANYSSMEKIISFVQQLMAK